MERRLWRLNWREFAEAVEETDTVILPIGVVEAHGPHLPLGTDFMIPQWIAERIADELNALIAPPISYGVVSSLLAYPGSMTVSKDSFESYVRDVLVALTQNGLDRVIILNGHGSRDHVDALKSACKEAWIRYGTRCLIIHWWIYGEEISREILGSVGGHAGTEETAAIMAIDDSLVRTQDLREQIYLYRKGIEPIPAPGSILLYDENDSVEIPSRESAERFMMEVVSRISDEVRRVMKGWDLQEIGF